MLVSPSPGVVASSRRVTAAGKRFFAWGLNAYGKLGDGTNVNKSSPVQIGSSTNWSAAENCRASSNTYVSALGISGGALFGWGTAASGSIGNGTTTPDRSSPVPVGALTNWTAISSSGGTSNFSGDCFSAGISGGALFGWGRNSSGQLGNSSVASQSSPVPVGAATDWTAVSCGSSGATTQGFSLGIRNGSLFAWGANTNGPLGDGTTASKSSPVPIGAATNWTAISAGNAASLAIRGGALFAWGLNTSGQLGDTTVIPKSSPVPIGALTNWSAISAGNSFCLGISGGALFAWGINGFGQLGDGTTANKSSPVPIGAATNWTAVAAGAQTSLGISGGALFGWGENAGGTIGDSTLIGKSSPVPVGAATNWSVISCGTRTSFGLRL